MKIIKGKIERAQKIVLYGVEGIGKTTFASKFPDVLFIDTEDSTTHMSVNRLERPTSLAMLVEQLKWVKNTKPCKTLAIDTLDWTETLVKQHIVSTHNVDSIEKVEKGYGKGYTILEEQFGKLLNLLNDIIDVGIHVVLLSHAKVVRFEDPTEIGAYDRWELKLEKKVAGKVKEWADALLFANYEVSVINVDGRGSTKGKNKAQGGERKLYVEHSPAYDAKNRFGLKGVLPFEFDQIAPYIAMDLLGETNQVVETPQVESPKNKEKKTLSDDSEIMFDVTHGKEYNEEDNDWTGVPKALKDLLITNKVYVEEIKKLVSQKGMFPEGTPIENYGDEFINGMIIGQWEALYTAILRERLPF